MSILSYLKKGVIGFITVFALVLFGNVTPANAAINYMDLSAPINISFISRDGENTTFKWMPPNINKTGEEITGYIVNWKNYYNQQGEKGEVYVTEPEATLPFMVPSATYSFDITATTKTLTKGGIKSLSFEYLTPSIKGIAPSVLSIVPATESVLDKNKVKIKWVQPNPEDAYAKNNVNSYHVVIREGGAIGTEISRTKFPKEAREAIVEIPKYTPNAPYYIFIQSYGNPNNSFKEDILRTTSSGATRYTTPMDSYYSCQDIEVMTARGSGEPYFDKEEGITIPGTEEQTLLTNEQIAEELPNYDGSINGSTETIFAETLENEINNMSAGYTVNSYAVPYPASVAIIELSDTWNADKFWENNPLFGQSVNIGTEMVTDRITQIRNLCPNAKIILSGYSQGALVMGNAIDALAKQNTQVDSVVLFGDPFFNPADMNADRSNFIPFNAGMLADRDDWSSVTSSPVTSYCHSFDVFCNLTNVLTKTWDVSVFASAAAISGGNVYGPHESYSVEWEPDSNRQAAVEGAWQAAEDLKMAFAMEN